MNEIDATSYDMVDTLFDVNNKLMKATLEIYKTTCSRSVFEMRFKRCAYNNYDLSPTQVTIGVYYKCARFCVDKKYRS